MGKHNLLFNFRNFQIPDPIPEVLRLLDMTAVYNKLHHVFEIAHVGTRYTWQIQSFPGGSVAEWTKFLQKVTALENMP